MQVAVTTPRLPFTLRPYQQSFIKALGLSVMKNKRVIACAPTGSGKCFAKGTGILMFDGNVKAVENIRVGDVLMGPDSKPRTVLSLAHGFEQMYDIIPTKGQKYTVNESHILSLKITGNGYGNIVNGKTYYDGDILNISVKDYLKTTSTFKHCAKGYRTGVNFCQGDDLTLDPYFVGLWLGDGSRGDSCITTNDQEITDYLIEYCDTIGCIAEARQYSGANCPTVYMKDKIHKGRGGSIILNRMKEYGFLYEKHIPMQYKTSSRENRLKMLAGLIDSDGHLSSNCIDYISKIKQLSEDFCFIARSLGFAAYLTKSIKGCKNSPNPNHKDVYYRVSLSGDMSQIPTLLKRKQASPRMQKKDVLNTGIKVVATCFGEYFGFAIDGDSLFLLSDFTVAHNSKIFIQIANNAIAKGRPVIIISESSKIFDQIINEAGGEEIANGVKHIVIRPGGLYIAMAQTLTRRPLVVAQFNQIQPPPLIIIDESHVGTSSNIIRALNEDNAALLLGFTATPDARVAKHLPELYNDCVVCCQVDDLIQEGFLCTYKHHARDKAGVDLLEIRNGEYTEASQNDAFQKPEVYDGLFEDLHKFPFRKCMVFVSSIKHAEDMYSKLIEAGFLATRYHSKLPNAEYELAKFTELDRANICVSVGSLTKGFDFGPTDLIILMRATTSLPLYLQMMGRASRPSPGKNNFFQVIDYGENWKRHGLYWDERDWGSLWKQTKKSKKAGEGVANVAMCPNCEAIISANQRICQYCDFERPLTEAELAQGELVEVTSHYTALIGNRISQLTPQQLAIYAKLKSKQRFAARIAKAQEQRRKGFLPEFAAAMGYRQGWVEIQLGQMSSELIDFSDITLR